MPTHVLPIESRFYSVDSLKKELRAFERRYDIKSDAFYEAYVADLVPERVELFDRIVWADTYEELRRLAESSEPPKTLRAIRPGMVSFQPSLSPSRSGMCCRKSRHSGPEGSRWLRGLARHPQLPRRQRGKQMTPVPLTITALLGLTSLAIGVLRLIEWANHWMKQPKARGF